MAQAIEPLGTEALESGPVTTIAYKNWPGTDQIHDIILALEDCFILQPTVVICSGHPHRP